MKRIIALILTLIMICSLAACKNAGKDASLPTAAPTEESLPTTPVGELPEGYGDCFSDAEQLFFIEAGDGEDMIRYFFWDDMMEGPAGFAVFGDTAYILDKFNDRILIVGPDGTRSLALSEGSFREYDYGNGETEELWYGNRAFSFCVCGDRIYVSFDDEQPGNGGPAAVAYDLTTGEKTVIPDEVGMGSAIKFYVANADGTEIYGSGSGMRWKLIPEENRFEPADKIVIESDDSAWHYRFPNGDVSIPKGETYSVEVLRWYSADAFVIENVDFAGMLEYSVRKYDMEGRLLGCSVLPVGQYADPEPGWIYVSPEGEIYTMIFREEGAYITKPNLRPAYRSAVPNEN